MHLHTQLFIRHNFRISCVLCYLRCIHARSRHFYGASKPEIVVAHVISRGLDFLFTHGTCVVNYFEMNGAGCGY